ncbi:MULTISPECIES: hypothetical protein [Natrialbaceae]|uniref:hypothetical protein n=1 Tax=Natrialbaceae TaxID=1644061 RepID=UPI00207C816F|nr:hypothetical protein [Natronococcus sp. CG52]
MVYEGDHRLLRKSRFTLGTDQLLLIYTWETRGKHLTVDRKTTRDIQEELIFGDEEGILEAIDNADSELDADEFVDEALSHSKGRGVAKTIFDEGLRQGVTDGTDSDLEAGWTIPVDQELRARAERYTGGNVASMSELNHAIDEANGTLVTKVTTDDGRRVGLTDKGRSQIFVTGSSTNAGVAKHRDIGEETYIHLTKLGLESEVVEQSGVQDVDGIARIRELLLEHYEEGYLDVRPRLAQQRYDRLQEEHPIVGYLTDGADVTVEFESTTGSTKKGQTVRNLSKAFNAGQVCVFVAREGTAHDVWDALTEPEYVQDVVGDREIFYNLNKIYIDGEKPVIENARTAVWSRNRETGDIRLEDEDGVVRARFDDLSKIFADRTKYDGVASEYDEDDLGRDGPHLTVNEPVIPDREFRRELPTTEDFRIVVVPTDSAGDDPLEALSVIDEKGVRSLEEAADSPGWVSDLESTRGPHKPEQDVQEESEQVESETTVEESSLYKDLKL